MTDEWTRAPEDSLLGLLQRGRGLGLQMARAGSPTEVQAALLECFRHDPRWDRQLESRSPYFAEVAAACDMPIEKLVSAMRASATQEADEPKAWDYPVAETLAFMALRGDAAARQHLVQEACGGPAWQQAAEGLARALPKEEWLELGPSVLNRLSEDEIQILVRGRLNRACQPWLTWASTHSRLREADESSVSTTGSSTRAKRRPNYKKADTSLSTRELINITEGRNVHKVARVITERKDPADAADLMEAVANGREYQQRVGFLGLSAIQDSRALEHAVELQSFEAPIHPRRGALAYLEGLPPSLTLPRARKWIKGERALALAGWRVLARHSTNDDVELIAASLVEAQAAHDVYTVCSAAEALTPVDARPALGDLYASYRWIPYSFGRHFIVDALSHNDARFDSSTAIECLFDCDLNVRATAIATVDLGSEQVRARLRELVDDPAEDEENRGTAREALAEGGPA